MRALINKAVYEINFFKISEDGEVDIGYQDGLEDICVRLCKIDETKKPDDSLTITALVEGCVDLSNYDFRRRES